MQLHAAAELEYEYYSSSSAAAVLGCGSRQSRLLASVYIYCQHNPLLHIGAGRYTTLSTLFN